MKKITSVVMRTEDDHDPDLSYLGILRFNPWYDEKNPVWIPVNPENLDEYWFSPARHLPHKKENWNHVPDEIINNTIKKYGSLRKADIAYAYEDCKRLMDYNKNQWWMEGIVLEARIAVSEDGDHWAHDSVTVSLWGIESDGGKEYKQEIIDDLKSELKHELEVWKFTPEEIDTAMKDMKEE